MGKACYEIEEVENGFELCVYPGGKDYSIQSEKQKKEFVFANADELIAKLEGLVGSKGVRTAAKRAVGRMPVTPVLKRY